MDDQRTDRERVGVNMIAGIVALLILFKGHVPDSETHAWTLGTAERKENWQRARHVFNQVRMRTNKSQDSTYDCQYRFEKACLKSIHNETNPTAPFDLRSPYLVIPLALELARHVGISDQEVVDLVAPK
jgi:hypothetical protein